MSRLVRNGTAALLFRSNYAFLGDAGGYFAPDAHSNILLHTWSLAVESQFYVGFAITCVLFWPQVGARGKAAGWLLFGVVAIASMVWCVVRTPAHQPSAFYLLWGRAWEFMAGSVVAVRSVRLSCGIANIVAVAGAALLLTAVFGLHADDPYPGWRAILPVAGTVLIICSGQGFLTTILSSSPFQFVGAISYSVYLWHWPILLGFRERAGTDPSPVQATLLIVASIAAGWLSYACIEQPGRKRLSNLFITVMFAAAIASGFAFTTVLNSTDGLQSRLPSYLRAASTAMKSDGPRSHECQRDVDGTKHSPGEFCSLGSTASNANPMIMLWGDSFANMVQPIVDSVSDETKVPGIVATLGGCPPFRGKVFRGSGADVFPGCERYANFAFDHFLHTPSIKLVVAAGDWQRYDANYEGNVLKDIAAVLAGRGGKLVLVTAVPSPRGDSPRVWARMQFAAGHEISDMTNPRSAQAAIVERGERIASIAKQVGNVTLVNPFDALCNQQVCFTVKDGVGLYKDTDHLTQDGVKLLAPSLSSAIRQALVGVGAIGITRSVL